MQPKRLEWTYSDCPVYYLTIVAYDRKPIVANADMHSAFREFADKAANYGVAVGRYVLMPDHIHLFAAFGPEAIPLSKWIKSLKNYLSKTLRLRGCPSPHFQKGFFDHLLRSDESYDQKWEYVRNNPVRAGLVSQPDDWNFQGELFDIQLNNDRGRS
jgi:REP-associated tyrosine transposase